MFFEDDYYFRVASSSIRGSLGGNYSDSLKWVLRLRPENRIFGEKGYAVVKRAIDLFLVLASAPFWLPVVLLCIAAVKIESPTGPAMFTQKRTGKGGNVFRMYKLRTMVPNAEELKKELAHLNELKFPDFKITNDPRITKVGRILRKTSLDELPQLFNVILGDMSLVGPRPTSFSKQTYQLWHTERLDVIPGITGLWQITGRASTEFDERLRLDILYINRRSVWVDIQILFRTVTSVLVQRGAH